MGQAIFFIQDIAVIMLAAAVAGIICKRAGISPIVGYLVAGVIVGPHSFRGGFIENQERVAILAELGMVFLMLGIGLNFSLKRLRQLGLPVLMATTLTAFLVISFARMAASGLGLDRVGGLFFAGLFVSSSSAVIGKILIESGRTHEKSGQLALGITLSEDMVAIVMLTVLGSYVRIGGEGGGGSILSTLGLFGGFVLMMAIAGLLVVPRVLRWLSREVTTELETVFVAGMLFGLSLMVMKAGYSLALGAFLLGAIIGETPQRAQVERAFSGLRDFFAALFFVAIGMTINLSDAMGALWPLAVAVCFTLLGRSLAAGVSLVLMGYDGRTAVRSGMLLTPLGEFGFIIAQLGTANGLLPPEYMSVAVGGSLITAMITPILFKSDRMIADRITSLKVPIIGGALSMHRRILDALQKRRDSSILWRLMRKRLIQIGVEMGVVTMVLVFAAPIIRWGVDKWGSDTVMGFSTEVMGWSVLGLLLLAPVIAIWRNIQASTMILSDFIAGQNAGLSRMKPLLLNGMQAAAGVLMVAWIWNFLPVDVGLWWILGLIGALLIIALLLWRKLIWVHSNIEVAIEETLGDEPADLASSFEWMDRYAPWGLHIGEVQMPERFAHAGKSINEIGIRRRFGCSIIGIERLSYPISNPGPGSHLFPGDKLLLLGTEEQIAASRAFLLEDRGAEPVEDTFRDLAVEMVQIPRGSPAHGKTLRELNWPRILGVQVVGHENEKKRSLTPSATQKVEDGDRILVLGTPQQVASLRNWLLPPAAPAGSSVESPDGQAEGFPS